jgi:hypothetical protein
MSFNRLRYDTCEYRKNLDQSVSPLSYVLNPMKYENCNKCRHELGIVGGPAVSQIAGDLVTLESDLIGITRPASKCPSMLYQPNYGDKLYVAGNGCKSAEEVDLQKLHLPPCQMITYRPVPLPPKPNIEMCPAPRLSAPTACQAAPNKPICM